MKGKLTILAVSTVLAYMILVEVPAHRIHAQV
jgi:hypothetical protein